MLAGMVFAFWLLSYSANINFLSLGEVDFKLKVAHTCSVQIPKLSSARRLRNRSRVGSSLQSGASSAGHGRVHKEVHAGCLCEVRTDDME